MKRVYEDPTMNVVTFETEDIMEMDMTSGPTGPDNSEGEDEF